MELRRGSCCLCSTKKIVTGTKKFVPFLKSVFDESDIDVKKISNIHNLQVCPVCYYKIIFLKDSFERISNLSSKFEQDTNADKTCLLCGTEEDIIFMSDWIVFQNISKDFLVFKKNVDPTVCLMCFSYLDTRNDIKQNLCRTYPHLKKSSTDGHKTRSKSQREVTAFIDLCEDSEETVEPKNVNLDLCSLNLKLTHDNKLIIPRSIKRDLKFMNQVVLIKLKPISESNQGQTLTKGKDIPSTSKKTNEVKYLKEERVKEKLRALTECRETTHIKKTFFRIKTLANVHKSRRLLQKKTNIPILRISLTRLSKNHIVNEYADEETNDNQDQDVENMETEEIQQTSDIDRDEKSEESVDEEREDKKETKRKKFRTSYIDEDEKQETNDEKSDSDEEDITNNLNKTLKKNKLKFDDDTTKEEKETRYEEKKSNVATSYKKKRSKINKNKTSDSDEESIVDEEEDRKESKRKKLRIELNQEKQDGENQNKKKSEEELSEEVDKSIANSDEEPTDKEDHDINESTISKFDEQKQGKIDNELKTSKSISDKKSDDNEVVVDIHDNTEEKSQTKGLEELCDEVIEIDVSNSDEESSDKEIEYKRKKPCPKSRRKPVPKARTKPCPKSRKYVRPKQNQPEDSSSSGEKQEQSKTTIETVPDDDKIEDTENKRNASDKESRHEERGDKEKFAELSDNDEILSIVKKYTTPTKQKSEKTSRSNEAEKSEKNSGSNEAEKSENASGSNEAEKSENASGSNEAEKSEKDSGSNEAEISETTSGSIEAEKSEKTSGSNEEKSEKTSGSNEGENLNETDTLEEREMSFEDVDSDVSEDVIITLDDDDSDKESKTVAESEESSEEDVVITLDDKDSDNDEQNIVNNKNDCKEQDEKQQINSEQNGDAHIETPPKIKESHERDIEIAPENKEVHQRDIDTAPENQEVHERDIETAPENQEVHERDFETAQENKDLDEIQTVTPIEGNESEDVTEINKIPENLENENKTPENGDHVETETKSIDPIERMLSRLENPELGPLETIKETSSLETINETEKKRKRTDLDTDSEKKKKRVSFSNQNITKYF